MTIPGAHEQKYMASMHLRHDEFTEQVLFAVIWKAECNDGLSSKYSPTTWVKQRGFSSHFGKSWRLCNEKIFQRFLEFCSSWHKKKTTSVIEAWKIVNPIFYFRLDVRYSGRLHRSVLFLWWNIPCCSFGYVFRAAIIVSGKSGNKQTQGNLKQITNTEKCSL